MVARTTLTVACEAAHRAVIEHLLARGLSFAFLEAGRKTDRLAILVHGFPDTPHTFDDLLPKLAEAGFWAVAPYTRGYAPSDIPPDGDYAITALAEDLLAWIEALGRKQAVVIAHDWGAAAAYLAARLAPERIEKLVAVAVPDLGRVRPTPRLLYRMRHFFALCLPFAPAVLGRGDFGFIARLYRRWSPDWSFGPEETRHTKESLSKPGALAAALGYYRAFVLSAFLPRGFRVLRLYQKPLDVPTLVLAGENDGGFPVSAYPRAQRVLKVPSTGHFLHRERPELFAEAVLAFLSE